MSSKFLYSFVLPILLTTMLSLVFGLFRYDELARFTSIGGLGLVLFANIAYVTFIDSRNRWPGVPWFERLTRYMNFER